MSIDGLYQYCHIHWVLYGQLEWGWVWQTVDKSNRADRYRLVNMSHSAVVRNNQILWMWHSSLIKSVFMHHRYFHSNALILLQTSLYGKRLSINWPTVLLTVFSSEFSMQCTVRTASHCKKKKKLILLSIFVLFPVKISKHS